MNLMFWKKKAPGDTEQGEADGDRTHLHDAARRADALCARAEQRREGLNDVELSENIHLELFFELFHRLIEQRPR